MKPQTAEEAYPIVLKKWEYILDKLENTEESPDHIYVKSVGLIETQDLLYGCAYCELFNKDETFICDGCPLKFWYDDLQTDLYFLREGSCNSDDHPFQQFVSARRVKSREHIIKKTKKMIDFIKSTKPENI